MNSLSVLIYLADISTSVSVVSFALGAIGLIVCAAVTIGYLVTTDEDSAEEVRGHLFCGKALKRVVPITAILFFVGLFTPSKEGIYLIAASEVGEEVVKSDVAKKSLAVIENYLDDVIADQLKARQK